MNKNTQGFLWDIYSEKEDGRYHRLERLHGYEVYTNSLERLFGQNPDNGNLAERGYVGRADTSVSTIRR